jgi:4-oxalocrotonate tautomerase
VPFINIKVAGRPLDQAQTVALQEGITSLMAEVLDKAAPLVSVLVEQVPLTGWSVGAAPLTRAAQVDALVSAGTNTAIQKAGFIAEVNALLKSVLGADLADVTYVAIHEIPKDSWGYGGFTQEYRALQREAV